MQYDPFVPIWILVSAWALSLAFIALSYYRKLREQEFILSFVFMVARLVAVSVVVFMLARPQIETRKTEKVHSVLPILVDASESMALEDQQGNLSRFSKAKDIVMLNLEEPLSDLFDLRFYTFGSYLEPQTLGSLAEIPTAYGSSTDIGGAISNALRKEGRRVDALIILSDGVHNIGTHPQDVAPVLAQEGIRVFTVGIGQEGQYKDVEVGSISVPDMVFMNEEIPVSFDIRSYGYRNVSAEVVLEGRVVEEKANGEREIGAKVILGTETVELSEKYPQQQGRMTFTLGQRGTYLLSLSVSEQEGERTTSNNRRHVEVNVTRERMHVLFIEGSPRWGFGFLVRSLRSDPRIALRAVVEMSEGVFYQQLTGGDIIEDGGQWQYPQLKSDLENYDLLILGDVSPEKFGEKGLKAIAESVSERGMALVVVGGPESLGPGGFADTDLEKILPIALTGEQQAMADPPLAYFLTPSGSNHPIFRMASDPFEIQNLMRNLPELGAYWPLGKAKPAALVLMGGKGTGGQSPVLLAVQKYGQGRTAVMATDKWYLWSFSKVGGTLSGQNLVRRFWQGFVRWIITGEEGEAGVLAINIEDENVIQGKEITIRVRYTSGDSSRIEAPELRVYSPEMGEKILPLEPDEIPGWHRASYQPATLGNYKLVATTRTEIGETVTAEKEFRVQPYVMEQRGAGMNQQLLEKLSADTNGKYFQIDEVSQLPSILPEVQKEVQRLTIEPLWNSPWLYGLLFLMMSFEWIWRRLRDLP